MKSTFLYTVIAVACIVTTVTGMPLCTCAAEGSDNIALTDTARSFLFTKYRLDRAQFVLQETARPFSLSGDTEGIEVRYPRWGHWWVGVEVYQKGKLLRTALIKFQLLKVTVVLTAIRPIRSMEALRPEDFVRERKAVAIDGDMEKKLVTSLDALENKRARYFINQGTPLLSDKIEAIPLVCRNEEARAVLERDDFSVESTCRALDNGFSGSIIRIRLLNGKTVQGVVDERGLVHVKF